MVQLLLPNLHKLALTSLKSAPTSVKRNEEYGTVTTTEEEIDKDRHILGESSSGIVVVDDDDSSSDDDGNAEKHAILLKRLQEYQARRTSKKSTPENQTEPVSMTEMLNEDELFKIFEALAKTDKDSASVCKTIEHWCSTNKRINELCKEDSSIWKTLMKATFGKGVDNLVYGSRKDSLGTVLIYQTFKDDDGKTPKSIFFNMCAKAGLVDVLQKRFVIKAIDWNFERLYEQWAEYRDSDPGLRERTRDMKHEEEIKIAAVCLNPDIGKTEKWLAAFRNMYNKAPQRQEYEDLYKNDAVFKRLVKTIFQYTIVYLFVEDKEICNHRRMGGEDTVLHIFKQIGTMLGTYIVCLWKLQTDYELLQKTFVPGDDSFNVTPKQLLHEIELTRTKIFYAVNNILQNDKVKSFREDTIEPDDYDDKDFFKKLLKFDTSSGGSGSNSDSGSDYGSNSSSESYF
jgi:hypothetical protein